MASSAERHTLHLKAYHGNYTFRRACSPVLAGPSRNVNARIMWHIDQALRALRRAGRRSIAMVDVGCGDGSLLVRAARRARALGFVAIEAKGYDRSAAKVAAARQAAAGETDPAMGFDFEVSDGKPEAASEDDDEPDVVLTAGDAVSMAEAERLRGRNAALIRHG